MEQPILRMEGIEKSFPGVKALRGVDLSVREVRCMLFSVRTAQANPPS